MKKALAILALGACAVSACPQPQRAYGYGLLVIEAQHRRGLVGYEGTVHGNLKPLERDVLHAVDFRYHCVFAFVPKGAEVFRARWEPDGRLGIETIGRTGMRHECVVNASEHKDFFYATAPDGSVRKLPNR